MSVIAIIGDRKYEFDTMKDLTAARNIYAACTGSQNEFEEILENEGIQFVYDDAGSYP